MKNLLPFNEFGCPYLFLAPMEGLGDRKFRKALSLIGGFDEAVRDFIRVPSNAHVPSLAKVFDPLELNPIPIAAQIMGSCEYLMAEMALELQRLGCQRIDINCGCPSNTVTGRGAGSSLLKDPNLLHLIVKSVVKAVSIPVTVKMRSGFDDTSLFEENLKSVEEAKVRFITLHPRTKAQGYGPPADWSMIAKAKQILKIPVVGNGDVKSVDCALKMLALTGCDALMIGRASVVNPFIFQQIKAHYEGKTFIGDLQKLFSFLNAYVKESLSSPVKTQLNCLKQLLGFLFQANPALLEKRMDILRSKNDTVEAFLAESFLILEKYWK